MVRTMVSVIRTLCQTMSKAGRSILTAARFATRSFDHGFSSITIQRMASGGSTQKVVPKEEVVRFTRDCLCKFGTTQEDGQVVGHHLMTADYCGHFSHGLNRLRLYVHDLETKITDAAAKPEIVNDFQAVALVNGNNGLGHVVGKFCMELAIEKAKKFGIGMVTTRGSNHYGICGYYTRMAMDQGLIGFSCTNTSPLMAPTRSVGKGLGTNPLSMGMSASNDDDFHLDMATTAVALGKVELAVTKKEPIPLGWALGSDGKVTSDAEDASKTGILMPLGGEEKTSGYKGYGLGFMVELLCGILSGSHFGPNIRQWKGKERVADLGHCFMAINPEAFGPGSKDRLSTLLKQMRDMPKAGDQPVLVAGDPERKARERVDKAGGIAYHPNQLEDAELFAKELGVQPMKVASAKVH